MQIRIGYITVRSDTPSKSLLFMTVDGYKLMAMFVDLSSKSGDTRVGFFSLDKCWRLFYFLLRNFIDL